MQPAAPAAAAAPREPPAPLHPFALFFHWAFKLAAWAWYLFGGFVASGFVTNFVVAIVLLALDFWTVKNVTGRLLVGLRWWNEANDEGSAWRFEALPEGSRVINAREKKLFWAGLVANPVVWGVFTLTALFGFHGGYLVLTTIAIIMGSSNLIGYYRRAAWGGCGGLCGGGGVRAGGQPPRLRPALGARCRPALFGAAPARIPNPTPMSLLLLLLLRARRCSKEAKAQMSAMGSNLMAQAMKNRMSSLFS